MNMRERMLAIIRGENHDRVPFVQYDGCGGPTVEVWKEIGVENMGILRWCGAHRSEHPNCRFEREETVIDGKPSVRNTLVTPAGSLTEDRPFVPTMGGVAGYAKHYLERPEDYQALLVYLRDIRVIKDTSTIAKNITELGENGLPHVSLMRTPFQQLWIEWVSIEDLSFHLADVPGLVEECMDAMGNVLMRVVEVAFNAADEVEIPYIVLPDNITAPVIGRDLFRKYCVPWYRRVADRMAEKGIPLFVHMDGDLKALWPEVGESGVRGIDSLSPPPDNDTSVADALSMWPEMRLLVNFPSSVHVLGPQAVYRQACEILEQGGNSGRLQIQISENILAEVWKQSFPEIVRAIAEFPSR